MMKYLANVLLLFYIFHVSLCDFKGRYETNNLANGDEKDVFGERDDVPKTVGPLQINDASVELLSSSRDHTHTNRKNEVLSAYMPGLTQQIFKDLTEGKYDLTRGDIPTHPDEQYVIPSVDLVNPEEGLSSVERIFGYFKPSQDGTYIFKISSQGESALSVSTPAESSGLRKMAEVRPGQSVARKQYDRYDNQKSAGVFMSSDKMYYLEVIHKRIDGPSHVELGATFPDGSKHYPLESRYFYSAKEDKEDSVDYSSKESSPKEKAKSFQDAKSKKNGESSRHISDVKHLSVEDEKPEPPGLKVRIYSTDYKCSKRGGHICKYGLSADDTIVKLYPRESTTKFILMKPALNNFPDAVSFKVDGKKGFFLLKDGEKFIVAPNDGSKEFATLSSFGLESADNITPSSYGIKMFNSNQDYICHSPSTADVAINKRSENCAYFIVPDELDMNAFEPSCKDYCHSEEKPTPTVKAEEKEWNKERPNLDVLPDVLNDLAHHSTHNPDNQSTDILTALGHYAVDLDAKKHEEDNGNTAKTYHNNGETEESKDTLKTRLNVERINGIHQPLQEEPIDANTDASDVSGVNQHSGDPLVPPQDKFRSRKISKSDQMVKPNLFNNSSMSAIGEQQSSLKEQLLTRINTVPLTATETTNGAQPSLEKAKLLARINTDPNTTLSINTDPPISAQTTNGAQTSMEKTKLLARINTDPYTAAQTTNDEQMSLGKAKLLARINTDPNTTLDNSQPLTASLPVQENPGKEKLLSRINSDPYLEDQHQSSTEGSNTEFNSPQLLKEKLLARINTDPNQGVDKVPVNNPASPDVGPTVNSEATPTEISYNDANKTDGDDRNQLKQKLLERINTDSTTDTGPKEEKMARNQQYITLHMKNEVGTSGDVRIISSIKPEGYVLGSDIFKLKIMFKYKYVKTVQFHGVDESGQGRTILLNGEKTLALHPSDNPDEFTTVLVTAESSAHKESDPSKTIASGIAREFGKNDLKISQYMKSKNDDNVLDGHGSLERSNPIVSVETPSSNLVKGQDKDDVPDVVEIAYDDDNAQKKTITEIHVGKDFLEENSTILLNNGAVNKDMRNNISESSVAEKFTRLKENKEMESTGPPNLLSGKRADSYNSFKNKPIPGNIRDNATEVYTNSSRGKKQNVTTKESNNVEEFSFDSSSISSSNVTKPAMNKTEDELLKETLLSSSSNARQDSVEAHKSKYKSPVSLEKIQAEIDKLDEAAAALQLSGTLNSHNKQHQNNEEQDENGRSQKKTLMSEPYDDSTDRVVEKKNIMRTINAMQENNYRSKLKTLDNFLREYTDEDDNQKERYQVWATEHQHPDDWYEGIPVTGVKRSPMKSYFFTPHSPTDPVVIHDDENAAYTMNRYRFEPKISFSRTLQLHDDKRAKIPSPVIRKKSRGHKHRRARRSICECDSICAGQSNIDSCMFDCENMCAGGPANKKHKVRTRRNVEDLEKQYTVFDDMTKKSRIVQEQQRQPLEQNAIDKESMEKRFMVKGPTIYEDFVGPYRLDENSHNKPLEFYYPSKKSFIPAAQQNSNTLSTNKYESLPLLKNNNQNQRRYFQTPQQRYYWKLVYPTESQYQYYRRWYQPLRRYNQVLSPAQQSRYFYNSRAPTQSQFIAKNMIPGYMNYPQLYQRHVPLFYERNKVPSSPEDVKGKTPPGKRTNAHQRIIAPVKLIKDDEVSPKKFVKTVNGNRRTLSFPPGRRTYLMPLKTNMFTWHPLGVTGYGHIFQRSQPALFKRNNTFANPFQMNVVHNARKNITASKIVNTENSTKKDNTTEKVVMEDKGNSTLRNLSSQNSDVGNTNSNNTTNGEKRKFNRYKLALLAAMTKSGVPYYVHKHHPKISSNQTSNTSTKEIAELQQTFATLNPDSSTLLPFNSTTSNSTMTNETEGINSVEENNALNQSKTADSKSRIINKIMNDEENGDKRKNAFFAIEIAEDEDVKEAESTKERGVARMKTTKLEQAKKEIEKEEQEEKAREKIHRTEENILFDNDVSSIFYNSKGNRNAHLKNSTGILKEIEMIQAPKSKTFVNHTYMSVPSTEKTIYPIDESSKAKEIKTGSNTMERLSPTKTILIKPTQGQPKIAKTENHLKILNDEESPLPTVATRLKETENLTQTLSRNESSIKALAKPIDPPTKKQKRLEKSTNPPSNPEPTLAMIQKSVPMLKKEVSAKKHPTEPITLNSTSEMNEINSLLNESKATPEQLMFKDNGTTKSGKDKAGHVNLEKLHTPKEIEAVYTDRFDGDSMDTKVEESNYEEPSFKPYTNHDTVNGDWFDTGTGFFPDLKTKQDIKMSKSGFLSKILQKEKVEFQKHKMAKLSPTKKGIEDKIKNIVKAAEVSENSELQNLITDSIGTALNDEQASMPLNIRNSYRNLTDLAQQDVDADAANSVLKPVKGDNNEIAKIMADYNEELSLNEKDTSPPTVDEADTKGEIMGEMNAHDQQEINALKTDLEGSLNQKVKSQMVNNFTNEVEDEEYGEKKRFHTEVNGADKTRYFANADITSLSKSKDQPIPGDQVSDAITETSSPIYPTAKEPNYRKHKLAKTRESTEFKGIKKKWQKVKEQDRNIAEEENESINDEMLEQKQHWKQEKSDENKSNRNMLNAYFSEVESKQKLKNKGKAMNDRQLKRQKKIKETLAMINDIENQIDGMIHNSDKSENTVKAKKKGKAAIFNELVGHKDDDDDDKQVDSVEDTHRKEKIVKSRAKQPDAKKVHDTIENNGEREELEDSDDGSESNDDKTPVKSRKYGDYIESIEDQDADDTPNKRPHHKRRHYQQRTTLKNAPSTSDDNSIASVIASGDRKVRQQQAGELLNLQQQEVNEDLVKLKEVTQDGLQNMFAKAVAKQQKFMDEMQGSNGQNEDLTARDQLTDNQYTSNDKLESYLSDQTLPYSNDDDQNQEYSQSDLRRSPPQNFNSDYDSDEELTSNRKSAVERQEYDDDAVDNDGNQDDNQDDNEGSDDYYDDDERRRRTV